jgi:membrane associated rhomboid family serine protease
LSDPESGGARGSAEPGAARPSTPFVVWALVGAIVLAHVAYRFADQETQLSLDYAFALIPQRFSSPSEYGFTHWYEAIGPLAGHAFLHVAWWHAGLNAFFLLASGRLPALKLGALRFLAVFFASVVGGALVFLALNWNAQEIAIGASGGVCGMFSAHFLALRADWRDALKDPRIRNPLGMLVFINVVLMAAAAETGLFPIAWEGHLGGFLGGAIAYVALAPKPSGPWG